MFLILLIMPIIQYALCNWSVWYNTDLFLDINLTKKNQKRLLKVLQEREDYYEKNKKGL